MAKYINREELVEWLKRIPLKDLSDGRGLCRIIMEEDFKRAIRTIPAGTIIDVAPVVHGRWNSMDGYKMRVVCSVCGWDVPEYGKFYSYCPNCGAKMDGGDGDAADRCGRVRVLV